MRNPGATVTDFVLSTPDIFNSQPVSRLFFFFLDPVADEQRTRAVRNALVCARDLVPDLSVSALTTFMEVFLNAPGEPLSAKDLAAKVGIPYATFMRHIETLSEGSRRTAGYQLLTKSYDARSRRHEIKVTNKGQNLVRQVSLAVAATEPSIASALSAQGTSLK